MRRDSIIFLKEYMINYESKISIIIPTYNQAEYLQEAVDSVLNQTYKNIEIIIIDDGSTDNTLKVVNSFNDNKIIFIQQRNKGASSARNTGIKEANGEYIAFLDSDDLWLKDKLRKQIDFMRENQKVGLLGTGCFQVIDTNKMIYKKIFPHKNEILQKDLIKYNPFIQSSVMVRKNVFNDIGLYDEKFKESEDYDLWLRIAQKYKIANLKQALVTKKYSKAGLSKNKDSKQLYFALKARKNAISRKQYPKSYYIYILKSWIFMKMPFFIRRIVRKRLLNKKFYN